MSAGIIRIQKFSGSSPKGIQIHDQRERGYSHSNPDIDFEKSQKNYDLHNRQPINYIKKIKERIGELHLPRAIRKDAVTMVQCMITSDRGFFDRLPEGQQEDFFKKCYEWVRERYGAENIISATVHMDEKTPHIHINMVPVTTDGRLCAKDLFKKQDLLQLHDDFYKDVCQQYGLERGERKNEIQKHLSVEEFKLATRKEKIKGQIYDTSKAEQELTEKQKALQDKTLEAETLNDTLVERLKKGYGKLEGLKELHKLKATKNMLGKYAYSPEDHEKIIAAAEIGILAADLFPENVRLKSELADLRRLKQELKRIEKYLEKKGLKTELERIKKDIHWEEHLT